MSSARRPSLYFASPLGFTAAGSFFYYEKLVPLCQRAGFRVLDPWKLTDKWLIDEVVAMPFGEEQRQAWNDLSMLIGLNNHKAIDEAQILCACLDGSDVDSGTAAEIGYAFGRGLPIIGYREDIRLAGDNIGVPVNLQVNYFLKQSSGTLVTSLEALEVELTHRHNLLCVH